MFWDMRENNTTMLEKAMVKSIFVAINSEDTKLRENLLRKKTVIQVEEVARERPSTPEPGEPKELFNDIVIETNVDTDNSYIFIDRTLFKNFEQEEIDELVYQIYEQTDFSESSENSIYMLDKDGNPKEINTSVNAISYAAEAKEEPEDDEKSSEENKSCDSGAIKDRIEKTIEESKKQAKDETQVEKKDMSEESKMTHPKYSTSNAKFSKDMESNHSIDVFKRYPNYDDSNDGDDELNNGSLKDIHQVEAILEHAISGDHGGKSNTPTPAKRLNIRNIITEASENEYITIKGTEGKDIKITMIIDRSGSMHGSPIYNSNIMVSALNNLSFKYPELDIEIILSCTGHHFRFGLPVDNADSDELWKLSSTGGSEGLKVTMDANFDRLKESDINLVYTDGSIQDDAEVFLAY